MARTPTPLTRRLTATAALVLAGAVPLTLAGAAGASTTQELNGGSPTVATTATAIPLPFGRWTLFEVGRTGSSSEVYRFHSDNPVLLRVTDAYCRGDEFRVYDRGFAIFSTTAVATDPSCDDDPQADSGPTGWADPSYSKGRFLLQPGHHWVRVQVTDSPFSAAGAWLRVDERPVG